MLLLNNGTIDASTLSCVVFNAACLHEDRGCKVVGAACEDYPATNKHAVNASSLFL